MSDIDPEVVRLLRDLLISTDMLGVGHQARAQDIAHQLDVAGKVIRGPARTGAGALSASGP